MKKQQKTQSVTRHVVTYINRDGARVLFGAAQGRHTYATPADAAGHLQAVLSNNSESNLADIYGPQAIGTFEVRPAECYPGHFDPMSVWFDE